MAHSASFLFLLPRASTFFYLIIAALLVYLNHIAQLPFFPVQPEVISIHLPKTAGSSFHSALHQQYGFRLKHLYKPADWIAFERSAVFRCGKPGVRAIHGHLHHLNLDWKTIYPQAKWITWLRDPAQRVVSAYHHWQRPIDHQDPHHLLFQKLQPNLLEFATIPEFQPVVQTYSTVFNNVAPADFDFIGRTEFFEQDLARLSQLMHWKTLSKIAVNVNAQKPTITPDVLQQLKGLLENEYAVYHRYLAHHYPHHS
jgi:hypothetical protein